MKKISNSSWLSTACLVLGWISLAPYLILHFFRVLGAIISFFIAENIPLPPYNQMDSFLISSIFPFLLYFLLKTRDIKSKYLGLEEDLKKIKEVMEIKD